MQLKNVGQQYETILTLNKGMYQQKKNNTINTVKKPNSTKEKLDADRTKDSETASLYWNTNET